MHRLSRLHWNIFGQLHLAGMAVQRLGGLWYGGTRVDHVKEE